MAKTKIRTRTQKKLFGKRREKLTCIIFIKFLKCTQATFLAWAQIEQCQKYGNRHSKAWKIILIPNCLCTHLIQNIIKARIQLELKLQIVKLNIFEFFFLQWNFTTLIFSRNTEYIICDACTRSFPLSPWPNPFPHMDLRKYVHIIYL